MEGVEYKLKKIDPTVKKETLYVAVWTFILSLLLQAVFLVVGRWDYTVLAGNVLGFCAATANFFLMGLTVQSALGKEEKAAENTVRLSQLLRLLLLGVVAVLGGALSCFNVLATVIPMLFPRIAVQFRPLFGKEKNNNA